MLEQIPACCHESVGDSAGLGQWEADRVGKPIAWVSEKLTAQCQKNRVLTLQSGPELTASDIMMFTQRAGRHLRATRLDRHTFGPILTASIGYHSPPPSLFTFFALWLVFYRDPTHKKKTAVDADGAQYYPEVFPHHNKRQYVSIVFTTSLHCFQNGRANYNTDTG